jgi:hypothetical protein
VYYSNWGHRDTSALWVKTGKRAWRNERGAFNPVISDGQTIYLTGFSSVAAFEPISYAKARARAERWAKAKQAQAKKRKAALAKKKAAAAKKKKAAAAKKKKAAAAKKKKKKRSP